MLGDSFVLGGDGVMRHDLLVSAIIVLGSILIGVGRFYIPGHDLSLAGTYEAFAHIFVGFLIAQCFYSERQLAITCLVILTVLETVMFLLR